MDVDLYKALSEKPLSMTVPGLSQAQGAQGSMNAALSSLDNINNALPGGEIIDLGKVKKVQALLNGTMTQINTATAQMQYVADNAIWISSKANMISSFDQAIGLPVSACFNADKVFGIISGSLDSFLSDGLNAANELVQKVDDYINGLISAIDLEGVLDFVNDKIQFVKDAIDEKVKECIAMLKEFEDKIMNSSIASTLRGIYNNPCTKALLDATLPPDIKSVLNR